MLFYGMELNPGTIRSRFLRMGCAPEQPSPLRRSEGVAGVSGRKEKRKRAEEGDNRPCKVLRSMSHDK